MMTFKKILPVAVAAAFMAVSAGDAFAKDGNKKSAILGAAAGVAIGAGGMMLYNKSQQGSQQQAPQQEYTGSAARPVTYQSAQGGCSTRPVELFDRAGNYVKTEKMRVCN